MRLKCFFSNAQHIQSRRDQTITTSIPVGCITFFWNGRKAKGFLGFLLLRFEQHNSYQNRGCLSVRPLLTLIISTHF